MSLPGMCGSGTDRFGQAHAQPEVEVIQGAGAHADQDFVGTDLRFWDIFVLQHFGAAVRGVDDGFHGRSWVRLRPTINNGGGIESSVEMVRARHVAERSVGG